MLYRFNPMRKKKIKFASPSMGNVYILLVSNKKN